MKFSMFIQPPSPTPRSTMGVAEPRTSWLPWTRIKMSFTPRIYRGAHRQALHSRHMTKPPAPASIADLVDRMSLEERVGVLAGADFWRTVAVPRLGVPQIKVTDGPAGARGGGALVGGKRTAAFPVGIALGATWSTELLQQVGELLAREVRDKGASVVLAPTLNL